MSFQGDGSAYRPALGDFGLVPCCGLAIFGGFATVAGIDFFLNCGRGPFAVTAGRPFEQSITTAQGGVQTATIYISLTEFPRI
jgi:hypothetical protein